MKAIKNIESYEFRDELNDVWVNERDAILKTAAIVTGVVVVAAAFFLGRHKLLNALLNSKLYQSGMELGHRIADTADAVSHKVSDVACAVTGKVMDTAAEVKHVFAERTSNLN